MSKLRSIRNEEKQTKRVDGEDLEKSAFAYRPSDKTEDWKLPIKFSTDEKTKSHIRNAIARWSSTDMSDADEKSKARGRIKDAAKEHDIDVEEGSLAKAKLTPFFRAAVKDDTLDLQIYEDIGAGWFDDGLTAKTVKQKIDAAGKFNRISVRINSPGGDVFEGCAIMNLLRAQKRPVDVYVDGIAASAASVIAMAGDTITMGRGAMMMIHNALMMCYGHAQDLRENADILDQVSASMAQIYVARTGRSAEEIKAMLDAETWMSAQECIANGFATALVDDDNDQAMAMARSFKSLARLKHVPDAFKAADDDDVDVVQCGCECDACEADDHANCEFDCVPGQIDDGAATDSANLTQYEARLRLLRA